MKVRKFKEVRNLILTPILICNQGTLQEHHHRQRSVLWADRSSQIGARCPEGRWTSYDADVRRGTHIEHKYVFSNSELEHIFPTSTQ